MSEVKIIFPHQLFENSALLDEAGEFYLVEESLFFKQYAFHKQKIAFHRSSMQFYGQFLRDKGKTLKYIDSMDVLSDIRQLLPFLKARGAESILIIDPVDDWLMRRITRVCNALQLQLRVLQSPMFLNTTEDLTVFFKPGKQKFFQTEFYKQQRIKRNLLLDEMGNPLGGQWSFDAENRKKYPVGKPVIKAQYPDKNYFQIEAEAYTLKHFSQNPGELGSALKYPCTFEESAEWLQQFLQKRMAEFGDYEDALVYKENLLNHSLLTPMLNVGLITPEQVINQTLLYNQHYGIPINSLEGFIRQIIGWREFIRGVYISKGVEERRRNFWGFTRKIPQSFYDGTTGIFPVDVTIKKVLKTGYCHHIERLMVLGNFMLLCEFDPDEVYRWFMELFIDSYDWVMVPNVYGMSQFADGGMMSTKPYISGSNYLMKMGDYPKGDWQPIWDALFWRFLNKQRSFFLQNPRLGMLVKTFDKWDENKKRNTLEKGEVFLGKI